MTNKRRHGTKKRAGGSITRRWVINNLGIIALVLTVLDFAFIYIMQNYYYSASQQYLNTKLTSVTGVLSRYSQDADINFSSEMRSTIENFSDKDKMELMARTRRNCRIVRRFRSRETIMKNDTAPTMSAPSRRRSTRRRRSGAYASRRCPVT